MTRSIHVFYDRDYYTLRWLRALVWGRKAFNERGVNITFDGFSAPIPKMGTVLPPITKKEDYIKKFSKGKFDIVFLAYHHSLPGLGQLSTSDRIEVLQVVKKHCNTLVWLDTADSTGTSLFDVMPYVDVYLKKQVLVDRDRYTKPIWGGRIFCEYYHKKYQIEDKVVCDREFPVLDNKYTHKLGISWNVGLGDLFTATRADRYFFHRKNYAPLEFTTPSIDRPLDVHYRGSVWNNIAGFQRKKAIELIAERDDIKKPDVSKKVPRDEYIRESKSTLSLVSPFGWGEICGRDFEAFLYGAALIKTDMSHMETYPNIYIKNKTYMAVDWNFENFNDIIDLVKTKSGREQLLEVANNGQNMYRDYMLTYDKKMEFADHILSQVIL